MLSIAEFNLVYHSIGYMNRYLSRLNALVAGLLLVSGVLLPTPGLAIPTQFGDTGLVSQPTAQTLNEGNICVGLWANCAGGVDDGTGLSGDGVIVPATVTMGLGTFMETFGSYPNLLFNGDEDLSGRGSANIGFKFRVFGKRSDAFRLGWDIIARRAISDDPDRDGLTDYVSRVIASYKLGRFGFHLNSGYAFNESPDRFERDDQVLFGAGVDYFVINRLRLLAEFSYATDRSDDLEGESELAVGLQYFLTPHLTLNVSGGVGLSDGSPDWRAIFGLTTCQGVGTYNRPVPKLVEPEEETPEPEPTEPAKPVKIRILTPLIAKAKVAESPVSHLEVPISSPDEPVVVDPEDRLETPQIEALGNAALAPIGNVPDAGQEVLPREPFAAKPVRKFRFPQFAFAFNQWDLSEEGKKAFSQVAEELRKDDRYFIISIEGHTDDIGPASYNSNLAFRRAVTAATHLVIMNGIDPARIFVKTFGETRPIASNETVEGRAQNRRVELLVLIPEGFEQVRPAAETAPDREVEAQETTRDPASATPGKGQQTAGKNDPTAPKVSGLKQAEPVDALSIEQAISEKKGSTTISPSGVFSQTGGDESQP